jgi:hypothetical protein
VTEGFKNGKYTRKIIQMVLQVLNSPEGQAMEAELDTIVGAKLIQ